MPIPGADGKGIATLKCEHSQSEATRMGFRAMQFKIVVATNESAVRLWQKQRFEIVGPLARGVPAFQTGFCGRVCDVQTASGVIIKMRPIP